jgi:hypothetical protein
MKDMLPLRTEQNLLWAQHLENIIPFIKGVQGGKWNKNWMMP